MHSVLRDLLRRVPAYVASTPEPEERINRPRQYLASKNWAVQTVESYSMAEKSKCDPAHVWKLDIPCADVSQYEPYTVELTHFIDGTQRTSRVCEIQWRTEGFNTVPLLVAQIACVVLTRRNRRLEYCRDLSQFKTLFEVPIRFLTRNAPRDVAGAFSSLPRDPSFQWVDTSFSTQQCDDDVGEALDYPWLAGHYEPFPDADFKTNVTDPNWLCNQSRKWTTKLRDGLEQQVFEGLADSYAKSTRREKHLRLFVKDGTLTSVRGQFVKSAVGLSKSFNTRFLEAHLQSRVLRLHHYHRTPAFKFERDARGLEPDEVESEEEPRVTSPQKHTVLSWYVRIRQANVAMPYWGLLRVEIHPSLLPSKGSADRWTELDSRMVTAISAAVICEASPTSQPDGRWHNLLYPISLCELFARSRMIPHETVRHLFTWGGGRYV
jgi:hypothetical protein